MSASIRTVGTDLIVTGLYLRERDGRLCVCDFDGTKVVDVSESDLSQALLEEIAEYRRKSALPEVPQRAREDRHPSPRDESWVGKFNGAQR